MGGDANEACDVTNRVALLVQRGETALWFH